MPFPQASATQTAQRLEHERAQAVARFLVDQYADAQRRLQALQRQKPPPDHPDVLQAQGALAKIKATIATTKQTHPEWIEAARQIIQHDIDVLDTQVQDLRLHHASDDHPDVRGLMALRTLAMERLKAFSEQ